jgi:hypothetical protein
MPDRRNADRIEKRGGYESGPKKVSELKPPPKGPGSGAKPSINSDQKK